MTLFSKLFGNQAQNRPLSASKVDERMSDEDKAVELAKLKEINEQGPSNAERERYRRRIQRLKDRGVPLRLISRVAYDMRAQRLAKRSPHLAA